MTEGSYISFGVEGVPYSQVRIELAENWPTDADVMLRTRFMLEQAVMFARILADEYAEAFYDRGVNTQADDRGPAYAGTMPRDAPPPDEEYAPSEPVRVPLDDGGREVVASKGVRVVGELFACPNCHKPAQQSLDQYQVWEMGEGGREYPQKFFCPNKDCSTKSLWRSKLVPLVPAGAQR